MIFSRCQYSGCICFSRIVEVGKSCTQWGSSLLGASSIPKSLNTFVNTVCSVGCSRWCKAATVQVRFFSLNPWELKSCKWWRTRAPGMHASQVPRVLRAAVRKWAAETWAGIEYGQKRYFISCIFHRKGSQQAALNLLATCMPFNSLRITVFFSTKYTNTLILHRNALFSCKTQTSLWKAVQLLVLRNISEDFVYKGFRGGKSQIIHFD